MYTYNMKICNIRLSYRCLKVRSMLLYETKFELLIKSPSMIAG